MVEGVLRTGEPVRSLAADWWCWSRLVVLEYAFTLRVIKQMISNVLHKRTMQTASLAATEIRLVSSLDQYGDTYTSASSFRACWYSRNSGSPNTWNKYLNPHQQMKEFNSLYSCLLWTLCPSSECQITVYFITSGDEQPQLFTLKEAVKLCKKPRWVKEAGSLSSRGFPELFCQ